MGEVGKKLYIGGEPVTLIQNNRFVAVDPFFEAEGPTYQFRSDSYSSNLYLAIPGSEFSTLGMGNYYDDVSADIRGTGTNFTANPTGSASEFFAETSTEFPSEDYTTSIYTMDAGSWGSLAASDLPFGGNQFVVEGYVYMDERFTKPPFWKVGLRNSNYNIETALGFPSSGTTDLKARIMLNGTQYFSSNQNIAYNLNQWYHVAWVRSSGGALYFYFNGTQYSCGTTGLTVTSSGVHRIFVGENTTNDGTAGAWNDFRVYIGTDKGYNTSTITPPSSIIEKVS